MSFSGSPAAEAPLRSKQSDSKNDSEALSKDEDKGDSPLYALAVCLVSRDACRAYLIIGVAYSLSSMISTAVTEAEYLYEDMEAALHVERPIRTRSDLSNIPVIGRVFQSFCDASDFVYFNVGLAKDYIHWVPVAATLPTVVSFCSTVSSALSLPTMALLSLRAARS